MATPDVASAGTVNSADDDGLIVNSDFSVHVPDAVLLRSHTQSVYVPGDSASFSPPTLHTKASISEPSPRHWLNVAAGVAEAGGHEAWEPENTMTLSDEGTKLLPEILSVSWLMPGSKTTEVALAAASHDAYFKEPEASTLKASFTEQLEEQRQTFSFPPALAAMPVKVS